MKETQSGFRASRALLVAVKTGRFRQYELARRAGLDPAVVSKIIHNAIPLKPNDVRVRKLARAVGLPVADAFERPPDATTAVEVAAPVAAVGGEEHRV